VGDIIASKSDLLEPHSHTHIVSLSCVAAYLLDLLSDALTVHPHAYFIEKYTHTQTLTGHTLLQLSRLYSFFKANQILLPLHEYNDIYFVFHYWLHNV